jgi:hypothetical protein
MKKALWIIGGHVVVVGLLFWAGFALNDIIKKHSDAYTGIITLFSVAFAAYTTALNFLYQRNAAFHLYVHRLLLKITRTHTFWQPQFDFQLNQERVADPSLLTQVWEMLRQGRHGNAVQKDQTPTTLSVSLDNLFIARFRLNEVSLCAFFDQKLLVPSHLYGAFRQRLALLAEDLQRVIKPTMTRCSVRVSFPEGKRNPYYGFFVNRLSPSLLQDFQVVFRLDAKSDCRIEAATDHVNVEGTSLCEMFDALTQVLTLRALPKGGAQ